jgi:magnesium-transporting ATPase (P-type)
VDPEQLERPHTWNPRSTRTFMIVFGLLSSVFNIITFSPSAWDSTPAPPLSRSGWFTESTITELAVKLVLRTNRPFYQSHPAGPCCCHRSPSPPSRPPCPTARWPDHSASPPPAWILAAFAAEVVRQVRDEIGTRVRDLLAELVPAQQVPGPPGEASGA